MITNQLSLLEQRLEVQPGISTEAALCALCEELLDQAATRPPVNVGVLASLRGIVDIRAADQPYAGMLTQRGGKLVVRVRASDGLGRRRFSVLHEAIHTVLPGFTEAPQYRCGDQARSRIEQLCDLGAAELLLPRRFFVRDLARASSGLKGVEELADVYEASIEATALRAVSLAASPAMLAVFSLRHKPSERGREAIVEPRLRLDYATSRGEWPYMRRHKSVSADSSFMRAFNGEFVDGVADLDEIAAGDAGPVRVTARRYGNSGRVLALVRAL